MGRLIRPVVHLHREGNDWLAYPWGRGAPVVRPVPGNTHPASAARWHDVSEAARELDAWGFDVAVFALRGAVTPLCSVRVSLERARETSDRYNADPFVEPGTPDPDAPYTVEATTLDCIEDETGQRWAVTP
jgi:hypothetical protein